MAFTKSREEVLNVYLAECVGDTGLSTQAENIEMYASGKKAMPDVVVSFQGLRCIIEGKWADAAKARDEVTKNAEQRISNGIAHIAVAVMYPVFLKETDLQSKKQALYEAALDFRIFTEVTTGDWQQGNVDVITDNLRRAQDLLASDDVVTRAVDELQIGMAGLAHLINTEKQSGLRLADILGVYEPEKRNADDIE